MLRGMHSAYDSMIGGRSSTQKHQAQAQKAEETRKSERLGMREKERQDLEDLEARVDDLLHDALALSHSSAKASHVASGHVTGMRVDNMRRNSLDHSERDCASERSGARSAARNAGLALARGVAFQPLEDAHVHEDASLSLGAYDETISPPPFPRKVSSMADTWEIPPEHRGRTSTREVSERYERIKGVVPTQDVRGWMPREGPHARARFDKERGWGGAKEENVPPEVKGPERPPRRDGGKGVQVEKEEEVHRDLRGGGKYFELEKVSIALERWWDISLFLLLSVC